MVGGSGAGELSVLSLLFSEEGEGRDLGGSEGLLTGEAGGEVVVPQETEWVGAFLFTRWGRAGVMETFLKRGGPGRAGAPLCMARGPREIMGRAPRGLCSLVPPVIDTSENREER